MLAKEGVICSKEGKKLIETIEEKGWLTLNGLKEEDEEGEYTYIGKGETVNDYVIVNPKRWDDRKRF